MPEKDGSEMLNGNQASDGTQQTPAAQEDGQQAQAPANFEEWLKSQPDAVQHLYNEHTTGLRNTVQATRRERDDLAKQVKEALTKAEKGSELEKSLSELSTKLELAERRASFAEEAARPEIGCVNSRLAWLVAVDSDLFTRNGQPDWAAIRAAAPELFAKRPASANGGDGTAAAPTSGPSMNAFIRAASGRS
jgi:hypothetical protein